MASVITFNILCDVHTVTLETTTDGVVDTKTLLRNEIEMIADSKSNTISVYGYEKDSGRSWEAFVIQAGNTHAACSGFSGTDPATIPTEGKDEVSQELADIYACVDFCLTSCCGTFV